MTDGRADAPATVAAPAAASSAGEGLFIIRAPRRLRRLARAKERCRMPRLLAYDI